MYLNELIWMILLITTFDDIQKDEIYMERTSYDEAQF